MIAKEEINDEKKSSSPSEDTRSDDEKSKKPDTQIITVVITGIVTIAVAYIGFLQVIAPGRELIRATQTAIVFFATQTSEANATSLAAAPTLTVMAVADVPSPVLTAPIAPGPICGRITSLPLGVRNNPAVPDNLPHYSRTIEVTWELPPGCKIIVEFLQNQMVVYKSPEPILSGRTDMLNIPLGWTEIKTWNPEDASGLPADDIHIVLCDLGEDSEC